MHSKKLLSVASAAVLAVLYLTNPIPSPQSLFSTNHDADLE
jgi:C1A family cysteine protease